MLEDQYKQACDELNEKKKQIKLAGTFKVVSYNNRAYDYKNKAPGTHEFIEERVRPQSAERRQDLHKIKTLENQLDKSLVKFNKSKLRTKTTEERSM